MEGQAAGRARLLPPQSQALAGLAGCSTGVGSRYGAQEGHIPLAGCTEQHPQDENAACWLHRAALVRQNTYAHKRATVPCAVHCPPPALHSVQRAAGGRQPLGCSLSGRSMPCWRHVLPPASLLWAAAVIRKGAGPKLRHAACTAPAAPAARTHRLLQARQQQRTTAAGSQAATAARRRPQVGTQPRQHGGCLQQLWGAALAATAAKDWPAAAAAAVRAVQRAPHEQSVAALPPLLAGRQVHQLRVSQLQPAGRCGRWVDSWCSKATRCWR